jgi:hypothetical protein
MVLVNHDGLKLNRTHQLLVYADDNKLGGSVHDTKENTEALVFVIKDIGLEVIARDQNAGRSHNIETDNSSTERWKSSNIWEP